MARPVVFLDACVLYAPLVRIILLGAARAGLLTPRWSPRVLDEWRIASARQHDFETEEAIEATRREMAADFPEASVTPEQSVEDDIRLPDAADAHVVAAAVAAGTDILLTFNLRDFPARRLAARGITPRHPDGFLWELIDSEPARMATAIREAGAAAELSDVEAVRRALKRAKLPRTAKAWTARAAGGR